MQRMACLNAGLIVIYARKDVVDIKSLNVFLSETKFRRLLISVKGGIALTRSYCKMWNNCIQTEQV